MAARRRHRCCIFWLPGEKVAAPGESGGACGSEEEREERGGARSAAELELAFRRRGARGREQHEKREKHEQREEREKRERPEPEPETEQRNRGEQQQRKGSVCSPSLPSLPSLSLLLCSFSFHLPLQGISRHGRPKDQEEEAGPELVGYDAVCVSQHIIPFKETWVVGT